MGTTARKGKAGLILRILATTAVFAIALTFVAPLVWMVSASFKLPGDIFEFPVRWIPKTFRWQNYGIVWNFLPEAPRDYRFALAYFNSAKVTAINVFGSVLTSCLAGYAFAKLRFKGRDFLFLLYLSAMMIPQEVVLIPKFILFDRLGLIGTHWPIILPYLVTPTGTFLMRQYFLQIPDSLRESAKMDGAREFTIWRKIMLPLAMPAVASLGVLTFMWNWNNFLEPLVFLTRSRTYTIPVALAGFIDENLSDYSIIMAASVSALLPMVLVFLAGQKYFIKGLTAGAVKG